MALFKIPITADSPSQEISIVLNEISYGLTAKWNTRAQFWTLDIADENDVTLISNIALKIGVDLLEPFNLGMGSIYAYNLAEDGVEMSLSNAGTDVVLAYLEPDSE